VSGRRLLLLRHGRTAWNDTGRAQGHHDVALDEVGHAQAATVAPVLAALRPAALWTSDLTRARQTCSYLERATGLTATVDRRLREYDVGARQGMTAAEFAASFPDAYDAWRAGDDMPCVPGAERATDVARRMLPALAELLAELEDGATGVVVTHGACLKVAVLGLLGWPLEQSVDLRGVDNGHWVTLAQTGSKTGTGARLRLRDYNRAPDSLAPSMVG
jgi:probable phosphoglycerate mutase